MKRRIKWTSRACSAKLVDKSQTSFRWINQKCFSSKHMNGNQVTYEISTWLLYWEGIPAEKFDSEIELKVYIIRFVYNLGQEFAVPSLLLYEADLRYQASIWVDEWSAPNKGHAAEERIIEFNSIPNSPPWLPISRKMCFEDKKTRKGENSSQSEGLLKFLSLNSEKKSNKRRLVPIKRNTYSKKTALEEYQVCEIPTYDRIMGEQRPEYRFTPVSSSWQDVSWESRPMDPLNFISKRIPSDKDCVTILTAEIGFSSSDEKLSKIKE